jgi:hypothetical protein
LDSTIEGTIICYMSKTATQSCNTNLKRAPGPAGERERGLYSIRRQFPVSTKKRDKPKISVVFVIPSAKRTNIGQPGNESAVQQRGSAELRAEQPLSTAVRN